MQEPLTASMREFLTWVSSRRRTYAEAMEAWRTSCPRHTVWEDALLDNLIQIEGEGALRQSQVVLTPRGRTALERSAATDEAF